MELGGAHIAGTWAPAPVQWEGDVKTLCVGDQSSKPNSRCVVGILRSFKKKKNNNSPKHPNDHPKTKHVLSSPVFNSHFTYHHRRSLPSTAWHRHCSLASPPSLSHYQCHFWTQPQCRWPTARQSAIRTCWKVVDPPVVGVGHSEKNMRKEIKDWKQYLQ